MFGYKQLERETPPSAPHVAHFGGRLALPLPRLAKFYSSPLLISLWLSAASALGKYQLPAFSPSTRPWILPTSSIPIE